jgi:DAK2 domain fusion protein YloV
VSDPAAAPATSAAVDAPTLDGHALRAAFAAAADWLGRNAAAIDAINVYPVPDGDTGSNMAATLRDALTASPANGSAGEFATALAHQALLSARGNSGVILSQWLRGLAEGLRASTAADGVALAAAMQAAAEAAYAATERPQEGTILTVARAAAGGASSQARQKPAVVLCAARDQARLALARTPELLPVLKQAGVVDSGGMGLVVLLEGLALAARGEAAPLELASAGQIQQDWLEAHASGESSFAYCTEFVLEDVAANHGLAAALPALGDSLLVVGEPPTVHIHLHTDDPGAAISLGTRQGALVRIKVEDMRRQATQLATRSRAGQEARAIVPLGVVCVVPGAGAAALAHNLGARATVLAEQGRNPSVAALLNAVEQAAVERALLLPGHKNVIMAAEQAAASDGRIAVVPTRSLPQSMSALLAFDAQADLATNLAAMRAAIAAVRTVDVTRAARATTIAGREVEANTPIALLDGEPLLAAGTPLDALLDALAAVAPGEGAAITLYGGATLAAADLEYAATALRGRFPTAEVDAVQADQPHYDFVAGVE